MADAEKLIRVLHRLVAPAIRRWQSSTISTSWPRPAGSSISARRAATPAGGGAGVAGAGGRVRDAHRADSQDVSGRTRFKPRTKSSAFKLDHAGQNGSYPTNFRQRGSLFLRIRPTAAGQEQAPEEVRTTDRSSDRADIQIHQLKVFSAASRFGIARFPTPHCTIDSRCSGFARFRPHRLARRRAPAHDALDVVLGGM